GLSAYAAELYETHTNARALGMGNAYAPIVNDDESLFYNPAGLAKNSGFILTIMDPRAGLNTLDVTELSDRFSDLSDDATFNQAISDMYGEPIWFTAGAKSAFIAPYFAVAVYLDANVNISIQNPA